MNNLLDTKWLKYNRQKGQNATIPNDHLQIDPQNLQDYPKDLQDDPQDFQDDPQKVHDDPLDLQDDPQDSYTNDLQNYLQDKPQESIEPEYAVETVVTETDESLPILEELEITMLEAQESETFKQDCIFESFKEYMEGIGCDNVELQKAIDNLKLMNKSFEPECANETDTFEQSENIDKPIETEKTKQPGYIDEINEFFEPECADKTDVTDTFETSENVYKPIRTEKTDEPSKPKELESRMNDFENPKLQEKIGNYDEANEFFEAEFADGTDFTKGWLILKCHLVVFKSQKKTNFFPVFLPQPLKRGQIKKVV